MQNENFLYTLLSNAIILVIAVAIIIAFYKLYYKKNELYIPLEMRRTIRTYIYTFWAIPLAVYIVEKIKRNKSRP